MTLDDLISRVERADSGDREIDAAVYALFELKGVKVWHHGSNADIAPGWVLLHYDGRIEAREAPAVSSSLDAVVALIRREMPGARWSVGQPAEWVSPKKSTPFEGYVSQGTIGTKGYVSSLQPGATEALALLLAFLRAVKAREGAG